MAAIAPRRASRGSILLCLSAENSRGFAFIAWCLSLSAQGRVCSQNNVKRRRKTRISLLGTMSALSSVTSKLGNTSGAAQGSNLDVAELSGKEDATQHKERGVRSPPRSVTSLLTLYLLGFFFFFLFKLLLASQFPAVQYRGCGPGVHLDGGHGG